mmetsp:Transcript_30140/g.66283  ORF Transcript_30140/g.66283 Transcript_30140/m.66283 type:complete len:303 (-) Transcript_30140:13-921(-)|eukprot:CAMPEP_0178536796 /NCGR_PEP_ID=MMETSP0696-20121128/36269_1 /TAXON_ID=265572 /ORGANISM="Extubocellulus spinifer, Strain CCMP396" /LENGTH=302 /DNA_ID=CAMNT_0020169025 /DNA_START=195 /DNA_END=1103 /DNA_ORIENTATION=+
MAEQSTSPPPTPSGAACWICLEEGPDGSGGPLMRNCACRGDSAGYAHVSCIVKYAQVEMKKTVSSHGTYIPSSKAETKWKKCPNCKQQYQGQMAVTLSNHYVTHSKDLPEDHEWRMDALHYSAYCHMFQGNQYDAAMSLFRRLLQYTNSHHPHWFAPSCFGIGLAYEMKKAFSEALPWYERARNASSSCLVRQTTRDEIDTAYTRVSAFLGIIDASVPVRNLVDIWRQRIRNAPDEYYSFECKIRLAECLGCSGQYIEALAVGKEAIGYFVRVLGPDHEHTMKAKSMHDRHTARYRDFLATL